MCIQVKGDYTEKQCVNNFDSEQFYVRQTFRFIALPTHNAARQNMQLKLTD